MSAEYKVNIRLNKEQFKQDLESLEKDIKRLESRRGTAKRGQSAENSAEKSAAAANKELTLQNSIEATRGRQIKLLKKNVEVGGDLVDLGKQVNADNIQRSRQTKLQTDLEIKQANNKLALEGKVASVVKSTGRAKAGYNTEEERYQMTLQKMAARTVKTRRASQIERRRSLSLGKDIVRITTKEVALNHKNAQALAKSNRIKTGSTRPARIGGDYSDIASRRAYTRSGQAANYINFGRNRTAKFDRQGALSSAMISGAFPLLFGQNPLVAGAGAIGGGVGGGFGGQMGGFAGGLVATAAASALIQFTQSISELGGALRDPANNLDALVKKLKDFDSTLSISVQTLSGAGLKQSAGVLAETQFGAKFGYQNAEDLQKLNKELSKFGTLLSDAAVKLGIFIAGPLSSLLSVFTGTSSDDMFKDMTIEQIITDRIVQREANQRRVNQLEIELIPEQRKVIENLEKLLKESGVLSSNVRGVGPAFGLGGGLGGGHSLDSSEMFSRGYFGTAGHSLLDPLHNPAYGPLRQLASESKKLADLEYELKELGYSNEMIDASVEVYKHQAKLMYATGIELERQIALESNRVDMSREQILNAETRIKLSKKELDITGAELELASMKAKKNEDNSSITQLEIQQQEIKISNLQRERDLILVISENKLKMLNYAYAESIKLEKELHKLNDPTYQLVVAAQTIGSAFEESFKGIIKGSMSASEALSNMFQRTADMFLDMAAQMIAKQIQMQILGIGFNLGSTMGYSLGGGSKGYFDPFTGKGTAGPNYGLAEGGVAKGGQPYVVGEKGPELFVPNYTGTVIPNDKLGGSSTNVVVNVDATGSSVQGDEAEGKALGEMLATAIQSELIKQRRPGGILT